MRFGETFVTFEITGLSDKEIKWLVKDCNLNWLKDKKEWQNTIVYWQVYEGWLNKN